MSYMSKVAEILNVELNEEFHLKNHTGSTYKLTERGLRVHVIGVDEWLDANQDLIYLLNGVCEIVKKPWKPKNEEFYYTIYVNLRNEATTLCCRWQDSNDCYEHYVLGNCFRSEEEAEKHKDKYTKWLRNKEPDASWRE